MCGHEQVRTTIFQHHPPLLAFQWGGESPSLNLTLQVHSHNTAVAYHLSGIIYYANQHFTAHVVNATGDSWYHDGMALGGLFTLQKPSQQQLSTAIVAMYTQSSGDTRGVSYSYGGGCCYDCV
ncbi:hypothetical protein L208DRAFT_1316329 [Tricholoma matsutake]|nr:hypothetical protein L208DRAFT_1316329 [Tricholoma matsutake 945]